MSEWDDKNCASCEKSFYGRSNVKYCEACQKAKTENAIATIEKQAIEDQIEAVKKRTELAKVEGQFIFQVLKGQNKKIAFYYLAIWLGIGICYAFYAREHDKLTGCIYRSVGSFINPGYIVGCELFRERWEIGKQKREEVRKE